MNRLLITVSALALLTAPAIAEMTSVPFSLMSRGNATLNQDGSWTFEGSLDAAKDDPGSACVIEGLKRVKPPNNPAPDNSGPLSDARTAELVCADPVLRPCLPKLRSTGSNWPSC